MRFWEFYLFEFPLYKVGAVGLIVLIATALLSLFFHGKGVFFWLEGNLAVSSELVFCLHADCNGRLALLYGLILLFTLLFFSPFLFFHPGTVQRKLPSGQRVERGKRLPMPVVERVSPARSMAGNAVVGADVQLHYAEEVLRRLQEKKLKEADRIETELIGKTLSVYRDKQSLTPQERRTLNSCLSSVLKLMAAYSV